LASFFLKLESRIDSVKNTIITLTDYDLAQIQKKILDLGAEINEFRGLLLSYQAKIRRTMILVETSQNEYESISQKGELQL